MSTSSIPKQTPQAGSLFRPNFSLGTINAVIADTQEAASDYTEALSTLSELANGPLPSWDIGNYGLGEDDAAPTLTLTTAPDPEVVVWSIPAAPAAFTGALDVEDLLPDPFDDSAPTLAYPPVPDRDIQPLVSAPTVDLEYVEPELDLQLPTVPPLLSLDVRTFDGVNIPDFSEDAPELTIASPTIREYTPGDAYNSALLTAINESLLDRIQNGGSGLNPDVENAIWDRARERETIAKDDELDKLTQMEDLGFSLPSGMYLDARLKIEREHTERVVGLSREIAINQAELEQRNVLAALETATGLESRLIDANNAVEQRLFESTRYVTEAGITIYNARVSAFAAYVDAYKSRVQAYEARIRGEQAKVDVYRAEIAAEQAKADINTALISQYRSQVEAALANVEVFKARLDGVKTQAEIEQLKVAVFGEQVRAYGAQINAYTADVEAYRARLGAEATRQEVFKSQVDAYQSQVQAGAEAIRGRVAAFEGQISGKRLELDAYTAEVQSKEAEARAITERNRAVADIYNSESRAVTGYNDSLIKQWEAVIQIARRDAEIAVSAAKIQSDQAIAARQISLDASRAAAQISAQLGAAALSTQSFSQSQSISSQASESWAYSASNASSWNYNYSENVSV